MYRYVPPKIGTSIFQNVVEYHFFCKFTYISYERVWLIKPDMTINIVIW